MNLLGFSGEPSSADLAGSGPTVTYPAPPSDSATPEAIASIAGGTVAPRSNSLSPGIRPETSPMNPMNGNPMPGGAPSYVATATPNTGAGQFGGRQINAQPVGFSTPSPSFSPNTVSSPEMTIPKISTPTVSMPTMSVPSGYQFGSSGSQPQASASQPSAYNSPISSAAAQANTFVDNVQQQVGGMTLPGSLAASLPASVPASLPVNVPSSPGYGTAPPATPAASAYGISATTSGLPALPPSNFSGYSPGSTSGSGYPLQ